MIEVRVGRDDGDLSQDFATDAYDQAEYEEGDVFFYDGVEVDFDEELDPTADCGDGIGG